MALHVEYTLEPSELPAQCIEDCSSSGDVSGSVEYWVGKIGLTVDRENAIQCLAGYGAWEDEELQAASDDWLAQRILWIACGDFSDGQDIFILE